MTSMIAAFTASKTATSYLIVSSFEESAPSARNR